jgi:hypothetical protein
MNNTIIEKIESMFNNSQTLNMAQVEEFVHEVLKFFDTLKTRLAQGSDEDKKAAIKEAQEMQQKLQQYAQKAYEKTGMKEMDIKKYLEQGSFPPEALKHFQNAEKEIQEFKKSSGVK